MSKHEHREKRERGGTRERGAHGERRPQQPHDPNVRSEHGGMPLRPDDDALARRAEAERAAAGLGPAGRARDQVPPAADAAPSGRAGDELGPDQLKARRGRRPYPPTRYEP
ncbi:hypothetical protein GCM10009801_37970 [Streptomyces albiaxialis]|uniref:DEAD/DEAH box helicase n=1 Tax=Streptomyces albiaxialis TaxID=329523 RepID=A0ABN2W371_9ACTN